MGRGLHSSTFFSAYSEIKIIYKLIFIHFSPQFLSIIAYSTNSTEDKLIT
jgi:hypothetical protein